MTYFLDVGDLLQIASEVVGPLALVADVGLLASAAARPQATVFGEDAYPALETKGAALLHSLVCNHALVDGNKRLGWAGCVLFFYVNGQILDMPEDDAYDFVIDIAEGRLDNVVDIAVKLHKHLRLVPPSPRSA